MPILTGFPQQSGAVKATPPAQKARSYTGRTILLNFASALTAQFRFVSTVTNLQQVALAFSTMLCPYNY